MNNSKNREEIDFLKGYVIFSPKARVLEVKALWNMAKGMEPCEERAILYLLSIESFFMQQETLYKFLKATKAATENKNFLTVLQSVKFNPEQDISKVFSSESLNIKYPSNLSNSDKESVKKRIDGIIKACRNLAKANEIFSSVYYIFKHGFLVYKKNSDLMSLIHEEKEKRFLKFLEEKGIKGEKKSLYNKNFDYIIDLAIIYLTNPK